MAGEANGPVPTLELDDRWFTILATSPTAVLVQHTQSGNYGLFKLEWRDRGDWPTSSAGDAWQAYMKAAQSNV